MITISEINHLIKPPVAHSHDEESMQIQYQKTQQKMLKSTDKDPNNLKTIDANVLDQDQKPRSIGPDYNSVK